MSWRNWLICLQYLLLMWKKRWKLNVSQNSSHFLWSKSPVNQTKSCRRLKFVKGRILSFVGSKFFLRKFLRLKKSPKLLWLKTSIKFFIKSLKKKKINLLLFQFIIHFFPESWLISLSLKFKNNNVLWKL